MDLKNGASLERGGQNLEAAEAYVHLEKGVIRLITATDAHGEEQQASRVVRFETPRTGRPLFARSRSSSTSTGKGPR